jgi:hypothetical protein
MEFILPFSLFTFHFFLSIPGEFHLITWYVAGLSPTLRMLCGWLAAWKMIDPGPTRFV